MWAFWTKAAKAIQNQAFRHLPEAAPSKRQTYTEFGTRLDPGWRADSPIPKSQAAQAFEDFEKLLNSYPVKRVPNSV